MSFLNSKSFIFITIFLFLTFAASAADAQVDNFGKSTKRSSELPVLNENADKSSLFSEGKALTKPTNSDQEWHFSAATYLYATGVSGTIGSRGRTMNVDASFSKIWKHLDVPLMGTFEARKKRVFILTDMVWIKLSDERDTPGGLYSTTKIGINFFTADPDVGYRLIDREKGTVDVFGGARIWSVENNIKATSGIVPGFDVSVRKTWAAPIVGIRANYDLSRKFFLSSKFDIGGAGIGADLTTQFFGGAGYRIVPRVALVGAYRFLQVDYDDHHGFLFDAKMNGLVFGAKFSF